MGIPFSLVLVGKNTIIVTSALTLIMSLGCLVPPTAIGGIFAARVAGVEKYSKVLKKCIIPSILTIIVGLCTIIFSTWISAWIDKIIF
jgi:TRAP-type C4-dicarboxylate transport system permease large subunit